MIPAAHVIFILDDSGSMATSEKITKKAFDGMVEALQLCKGADIVMSLIKYGSTPKLIYGRAHIQEVKPISYMPRNDNDSIYDSLLFALKLAETAPREEKTIIILQADGGDTCSRVKPEAVKSLVLQAKTKGMEFLFLGANYMQYTIENYGADAERYDCIYGETQCGSKRFIMNCAERLGFEPDQVMLYNSNTKESVAAFAEAASNIGSVASRLREHADFTKDQQEKVRK